MSRIKHDCEREPGELASIEFQTAVATQRAVRRHASVFVGGYEVPLIGIPRDASLEECDCCHEIITISAAILTGTQILCAKCAKP